MSIIDKIFKKSTDEAPAEEAAVESPANTAEPAEVAEVEVEVEATTSAPEVVAEEVKPDTAVLDSLKAEYEAKLKELEDAKQAIEAEKAAAMERAETAEKSLADQKASNAIAKAVSEGRLTPSQVGEGSIFVRLAHDNPDLFAEIVNQLHTTEFPVEAKLTSKENLVPPRKTLTELVAAGADPMRAFEEVLK